MDGSDPTLAFRAASPTDWIDIWPIFDAVVASGDTYVYSPDTSEADAEMIWMQPGVDRKVPDVAVLDESIVGTAYLQPTSVGLGDHVCNAGWMIDPSSSGKGVVDPDERRVVRVASSSTYSPARSSSRWR